MAVCEACHETVARLEVAQGELEAQWQAAQGAAPASAQELERVQVVIEGCAHERALHHDQVGGAYGKLDGILTCHPMRPGMTPGGCT